MKKAKKMALQAIVCAAFAATMVLAGCTTEEGGNSDMIEVNGRKATIECPNDTDEDLRGFKTIRYTHTYAECEIEIKSVSSAGNSAMGLVFGCENTGTIGDDKLYSFYRIAVKNKATDGNKTYGPCFYVDYVKNIPASKISTKESASYSEDVSGYIVFDTSPVTAQTLKVKVTVEEAANGSLNVTFYDKDNVQIGHYSEGKSTAGWTEQKGLDVGFYAIVAKGSSLTGNWNILDTKDAEVAEAE